MKAVEQYLVRRGDGLVLLFTPPFDRTPLDPGYIKGYVPGIRENGGQYTHAALWSVIAFAELGDGDKATELFSILNPINHASTRAGIYRYKVEPYVAVADVYAEPPHVGRARGPRRPDELERQQRVAGAGVVQARERRRRKPLARPRVNELAQRSALKRRDRELQVTSLIDYIDGNTIRGVDARGTTEDYGYESLKDHYKPKNTYLDTVGELKLARGVEDIGRRHQR